MTKMLGVGIKGGNEEISVLHVDDDPNQFEFIKFFLNQADEVLKVTCVDTPTEVFKIHPALSYQKARNSYPLVIPD